MKTKLKNRTLNVNARKDREKILNPFEVHINRSKHEVLGRKLKSEHGLPGISRTKAIQKRTKTLLQEYKMKDKANHFIDQRIGERNSGMTEDDKIMARFTAERMRMFNKKAMFNLSDSEVLTHRGQTLSEIEKFTDVRSDDDDDDEDLKKSGALKGKFVGDAHFGGGMLTKSKRDRESLINDLINESKRRKADRQRNKEETLEATEQLDEEWKSLGEIITSKPTTNEPEITQMKDNYDVVMRQFKFEPQAKATQRLKTDEEIAKEDKEKLEMLEKERLKQLREMEAFKYGNYRSADDLDDGFSNSIKHFKPDSEHENGSEESSSGSDMENEDENQSNHSDIESDLSEHLASEYPSKGKSKTKQSQPEDSNSILNEDGEEDTIPFESEDVEKENNVLIESGNETTSDHSIKESESDSSDEEYAMDDLSDLMPVRNEAINGKELKCNSEAIADNHVTSKKVLTSKEICENKEAEPISDSKVKKPCTSIPNIELDLPYVINVPETLEDFEKLIHNRTSAQLKIIFDRLFKTNHPSLDPSNKKKMCTLAEYIITLVSQEKVDFEAIPVLATNLRYLKEFNKEECLKMLLDSVATKLDSEESLPSSMKSLVWHIELSNLPQGLDVLLPINKPILSLASRIVSSAEPLNAEALLFCHLLLQNAKNTSTVYTDAILFLHNCVKTIINNKMFQTKLQTKSKNGPIPHKLLEKIPIEFKVVLNFKEADVQPELSQVLLCSLVLLAGFIKTYRKYPQSQILFKSLSNTLAQIKTDQLLPLLQEAVLELKTLLKVLFSAPLPPLIKAAKKPKALRQYEPSFYTVTVGKSVRGLPEEQAEEKKLLHKYKHEMKGAMRELRRDRVFLANIKLKEKAQSDEQRIKKVKEIFGSAAAQQGELRKLKRKK